MAEFKMANIIKLSENEWVWVRLNLFESDSEWSESVFEWIWEKITRCLNPRWHGQIQDGYHHQVESEWMSEVFFCSKLLTRRRQNSRWLTSSSWVRMNDVESDWISLSQSFVQNGWIQGGRIQDGCHHQINQIELVWVRVRVEWECFWVNLREDNKAVCIQDCSVWNQDGRFQDGCHHQVESEWICEGFLCKWWKPILASVSVWEETLRWLNPSWQIHGGRIQDGCHHQVNWEWISLSQIELVWVRVRVEWECFWVNLREDNKVSQSKMAVAESNMAEFKMAAIIKLSQNEWVKFFLCQNELKSKMAKFMMAEFKMAAIIKLSENEWVKFFFVQNGWIQDGRIQDGWHHQVEWEWMSLSQIELVWVRVLCKMAESKVAEFMMDAIIRLIRLN